MAGYRTPGPMCSVSKPVKIDAGTMCRSATPAPGPTCTEKAKSNSGMHSHNLAAEPQKASEIGFGILSEVALGDFHQGETTWTGRIINVGIGLIPIVGQAVDVRDTAAAVKNVWQKPTSELAWAGLGMAIVGWIPLIGDTAKGATKVGKQTTIKIGQNANAVVTKTAATGLGEQMIKGEKRTGLNVDVAAQEYQHSRLYREGSGRDMESAHLVNSSSVRDVPGYVRKKAVTVLLPKKYHRAFDDYWMKWARGKVKPGEEEISVTVSEWEKVLNKAILSVPELQGRTADTISFMIRTELYQTLGLNPDQHIRVPFSK